MRACELTGQRYGRLVVERRDGSLRGCSAWIALCDCGRRVRLTASALRTGNTQSCGCLKPEVTSKVHRKHGATVGVETLAYRSWKSIKARCLNPKAPRYESYGGRGITICDRWLGPRGFENFLADMGERPAGTSIDRRDNDRGYSCGKCDDCLARGETANCRWATPTEQSTNRRGRCLLTVDGLTMTQAEWERAIGLSRGTISDRRNNCGWSDEEAVLTPKLSPSDAPRFRRRGRFSAPASA